MKVDWIQTPMYNTLMAVAAGVGLILVVLLGRSIWLHRRYSSDGYALAFGAIGAILFLMGLHMSLTWPLARIAPFDNIMFGEPSVAFGALLLGASLYLWRRGTTLQPVDGDAMDGQRDADFHDRVAQVAFPISLFVAALGLACFAIAAAGWRYTLWAAPPQEPISGLLSSYPLLEASFIALLYVLIGLGSVLLPVLLLRRQRQIAVMIGVCWGLSGLAWTLFGALNYFTHTGLIINTS